MGIRMQAPVLEWGEAQKESRLGITYQKQPKKVIRRES